MSNNTWSSARCLKTWKPASSSGSITSGATSSPLTRKGLVPNDLVDRWWYGGPRAGRWPRFGGPAAVGWPWYGGLGVGIWPWYDGILL